MDGCVAYTLEREGDKGEVVTTDIAPGQWITEVKQAWLLPPFLKQLQKRQREQALLEKLGDCLDLLYQGPHQPGLHLETLHTNTPQSVLSARIDRSDCLILTPLPASEVGLLYFDNHDEAYDWVQRLPGMGLSRDEHVEFIRRSHTHLRLALVQQA